MEDSLDLDLDVAGGSAEAEEARLLGELQESLRTCLADLAEGVTQIGDQLARGVEQLRAGDEPRSLAVALENLGAFFALLARMTESFEGRPLPALDAFDAAVRAGVQELEASLDGLEPAAVADAVAGSLGPALDGWPKVGDELAAAIAALSPGLVGAFL